MIKHSSTLALRLYTDIWNRHTLGINFRLLQLRGTCLLMLKDVMICGTSVVHQKKKKGRRKLAGCWTPAMCRSSAHGAFQSSRGKFPVCGWDSKKGNLKTGVKLEWTSQSWGKKPQILLNDHTVALKRDFPTRLWHPLLTARCCFPLITFQTLSKQKPWLLLSWQPPHGRGWGKSSSQSFTESMAS